MTNKNKKRENNNLKSDKSVKPLKAKQFRTVFKKEILDIFRDKKTIIISLVVPLMLLPLMFIIFSMSAGSMIGRMTNPKITIVEIGSQGESVVAENSDMHKYVTENILKTAQNRQISYKIEFVENPIESLINGEIHAILKVEKGVEKLFDKDDVTVKKQIKLISDERALTSSGVVSALFAVINDFKQSVYDFRLNIALENTQTNPDDLNGAILQETTIENEYPDIQRKGTGNIFIQMLVPFILVLSLAIGGTSIAVDIIAGEKERNTFEALLSTSASRFSILSAKFLVVLIFSFVNVIFEFGAIALSSLISPELLFGSGGFNLEFGAVALLLINLLVFAAIFTSILMVVSASSKNYKEATTKASFLSFLPFVSVFAMFMDASDITIAFMFIPILNVVCLTKMVLSGFYIYSFMFTALAVNVAIVTVCIYYTLRTFKKEKLISRS